MSELSMWDYEGRIQETIASGEAIIVGMLCPDCYGLVPRIADALGRKDGRFTVVATVRMCACGLTTTGDADRAAHGIDTYYQFDRGNKVRE